VSLNLSHNFRSTPAPQGGGLGDLAAAAARAVAQAAKVAAPAIGRVVGGVVVAVAIGSQAGDDSAPGWQERVLRAEEEKADKAAPVPATTGATAASGSPNPQDPCKNPDGSPKWQAPNTRKANQFTDRGWGGAEIGNTLANPSLVKVSTNLTTGNSANVYYRPDGHYVVQDNITCDVIQTSNTRDYPQSSNYMNKDGNRFFDPFGDPLQPR
jgi:hypothetical protein